MNIPWRLRVLGKIALNAWKLITSVVARLHGGNLSDIKICFRCKFHGTTGATIAIARIANVLAKSYRVYFEIPLTSDYPKYLQSHVIVSSKGPEDSDIFVVDGNTPLEDIVALRQAGRRVIISAHGILPANLVLRKISAATATHFVSEVQLVNHPNPPDNIFFIPNYSNTLQKTFARFNVGIVGRVFDEKKRIRLALSLAEKSNASHIHVWGGFLKSDNPRVTFHNWTAELANIYASFGVLLSLSQEESFSLTAIEAMSAGIFCVLSDIPAHRRFRDAPGIKIVDPSAEDDVVNAINYLLHAHEDLRSGLIEYWQTRYSEEAVQTMWNSKIEEILRL